MKRILGIAILTAGVFAAEASAAFYVPTQAEINTMININPGWGGTGVLNSKSTVGGDAVNFNITQGNTGDNKTSVANDNLNIDLSGFDGIQVTVDVISGGPFTFQFFGLDTTNDFVSANSAGDFAAASAPLVLQLPIASFTNTTLDRFGFSTFGANDLNSVVQIIGIVPEPTSLALLGLAIPALAIRRRRVV